MLPAVKFRALGILLTGLLLVPVAGDKASVVPATSRTALWGSDVSESTRDG